MASELRKQKYRHIFCDFLDNDKNGVIDKKDIDLLVEKAAKLKGWAPNSSEYKEAEETWDKIWTGMQAHLDANKDGQITMDEWMVICDEYAKRPAHPPEWQVLYEDFVYRLVNADSSGKITKENYLKVYDYYGMGKDVASKSFDVAAKGKNSITRSEYKQLWTQFFTSDDPNAPGNYLTSGFK